MISRHLLQSARAHPLAPAAAFEARRAREHYPAQVQRRELPLASGSRLKAWVAIEAWFARGGRWRGSMARNGGGRQAGACTPPRGG